MLFWLNFFTIFVFISFISLSTGISNLFSFLLISEIILILIFYIFIFNAVVFNLNWIFGFSIIIVILGGLEISLSFLLLNL